MIEKDEVEHSPACTWLKYVEVGEKPPGQSFWGELNYLWCKEFCERPMVKKNYE